MKALIQMTIDTERTEEPAISVVANGVDMWRGIIDARSYEEASTLIQEAIQRAENAMQEYTVPDQDPELEEDHAEGYICASVSAKEAREKIELMKEYAAQKIQEIDKAVVFAEKKKSAIDLITGRYLMLLGYADHDGSVDAFCKSYSLGFMRGFRKAKREQKAKEGK